MTSPAEVDPFAGADKVPSISFKDQPIGTTYTGKITEAPVLRQSRNFETGEPDFWPAKAGQTPNPKMAAVFRMTVNELGGEERAVWATKPSALYAALAEARSADPDKQLKVGGDIAIRYTGDKPNENPRLNPAKQYAVRYTPPTPAASAAADPWADSPSPAANEPAF